MAARGEYLLGHADAALQEGEVLLARELLTTPAATALGKTLSGAQRLRWLRLRGELFGLLGETAQSLSAYTALATELQDPDARAGVEQRIWTVLQQTPTSVLRKLVAEPADPHLHSWYQLALAGRETEPARSGDRPTALPQERTRILSPAEVESLNRVALLLPESGTYAAAAEMLRDGFLAAAFAARAGGVQPPDVRFYDTAAGDVLALYGRAVDEGAQLVIGPLEPELLRTLRDQPRLPVPILSLNYLEADTAASVRGFYQFGLSVAEEAVAVAHTARRDGHRRALALVPNTSWGRRALQTFTETFTELGGEIPAVAQYDMALKDFTPVLRPLLAPQQTRDVAAVGENGEPPRRRTDLDMVFLVAYPTQGRQIQPTLEFLYAGDLPIYATSAIYSGTPDPVRDRDLGDIRFSASPWTLADPNQLSPWPEDRLPPAHRQLFALGVDSYLLHAQLADGMPGLARPIPGQTGLLMLDGNGRVQRLQPWARFRNGRAVPLLPAAPDQ